MIITFNAINLLLIFSALSNLLLGVIIFVYGPKKKINVIYSLNIIGIIGWTMAMVLFRSAPPEKSVFWCTVLYIVPSIVASSFLYFTYIFPSQKEKIVRRKLFYAFLINALIILIIAWPGLMISEVNARPGLEKEIIFTKYYWFYFLYMTEVMTYAFIRLYKKRQRSMGKERVQIAYLLAGYALPTNLAFVTNLILPWIGVFCLNWLGQVFTIFMVSLTTYAIITHNYMGIKFVLRKSSVYFASILTIVTVVFATKLIISSFLVASSMAMDAIILLLVVTAYPKINSCYYQIANKYFFSSLYDSREIIAEVNFKIKNNLEPKQIYEAIYSILSRALHFKSFGVLFYDEQNKQYAVRSLFNKSLVTSQTGLFEANSYLNANFISKNKPIVTSQVKNKHYLLETKQTIDLLIKEKIEVLAPLNTKDHTIGLLALGPKESKEIYGKEDLQLLEIVSGIAAVAIENAELYTSLEKKVEERTREIKLLQDEQKQSMVDIAHNLQTPLTLLKAQIDNLQKNNPFNKELADLEISISKVSKYIYGLLALSKLEKVKLIIAPVNLSDLISDLAEYFQIVASEKNISIQPSIENNIMINGERNRLEDLATNLLGNSLKYINQGDRIDIKLFKIGKIATLIISDTGPGISEENLKIIFERFNSTLKTKPGIKSSGLGLAICKKIVDLHGGTIKAENDRGAKITIKFPLLS